MASEPTCDITIEDDGVVGGPKCKIIVDGRDISRFVTSYKIDRPAAGPMVVHMKIARGANLVVDGFAMLEGDDGVNHFTIIGPRSRAKV